MKRDEAQSPPSDARSELPITQQLARWQDPPPGKHPFGNDPAKIERYRAFWERRDLGRPLVGFSLVGWFPFREFRACRSWSDRDYLSPEMIDPQEFLEDHLRICREGELIDDDVIRGACPAQVAIPWLPGMLGARLRILPDNVLGEEMNLPWDLALQVRLDRASPWYQKYMEFIRVLVRHSDGQFPVSHSAELGPTDLHALLRGHTQSILDLVTEPANSARLLWRMGEIFVELTQEIWQQLPRFHGGYFDAQYSLWAPGSIVRMQEDATALYSPELYREFVQPVDRMIASQFDCSFIHLHSTSMFLLDGFLEIDEIRCFEINKDATGPSLRKLIPYLQTVQQASRPLLVRGSFTPAELALLLDSLESRGLMLQLLVTDLREVEGLKRVLGM